MNNNGGDFLVFVDCSKYRVEFFAPKQLDVHCHCPWVICIVLVYLLNRTRISAVFPQRPQSHPHLAIVPAVGMNGVWITIAHLAKPIDTFSKQMAYVAPSVLLLPFVCAFVS